MLPASLASLGYAYAVACFSILGFVAGGTVPLVLKAVRKLYSMRMIGIGRFLQHHTGRHYRCARAAACQVLLAASATGTPGHLSCSPHGYTEFVLLSGGHFGPGMHRRGRDAHGAGCLTLSITDAALPPACGDPSFPFSVSPP